ncbi:hypothetical protein [Desulfoluna spongiiphila]|uniref:MetA-pathway of phenol degradation n=1 Tax=Desulfoluna spongiiphila TaxID=419481 RepID=A0A1G5G3D6_9BACT|nr:hypothetical protein [Desulfoluna spongiiphila]SCY45700.1 hypothetical protein SAMN05216233_109167 [Desulfoluna spongiiphila]VVS91086.1 hypothetical protein DBB_6540 [Desulfoluna spongiiphila]
MKRRVFRYFVVFVSMCALLFSSALVAAEEQRRRENASNPLAKVKNTDLRWQYLDLDSGHVNDFSIDGAFMAHEKVKIKYELHYWETNVTGSSEKDFESALVKGIFFPSEGVWGNVKYRLALGFDWIVDLGDLDKGIGTGSDQIGPFGGVALGFEGGTMLIPLVQQYLSYSGEDVNTTAFRVITLKPLPKQMWIKLDAKVPVDWENDEAIPANAELQLGKHINKNIALYLDGLVGIGGDKPYDWGVGTGLRFKY